MTLTEVAADPGCTELCVGLGTVGFPHGAKSKDSLGHHVLTPQSPGLGHLRAIKAVNMAMGGSG